MDALAESVQEYVENRRWDTLAGRAYDMHSNDGRKDFATFLTTHIRGLLRYMDEKGDTQVWSADER